MRRCRYTTKHLNHQSTPKNIRTLLAAWGQHSSLACCCGEWFDNNHWGFLICTPSFASYACSLQSQVLGPESAKMKRDLFSYKWQYKRYPLQSAWVTIVNHISLWWSLGFIRVHGHATICIWACIKPSILTISLGLEYLFKAIVLTRTVK